MNLQTRAKIIGDCISIDVEAIGTNPMNNDMFIQHLVKRTVDTQDRLFRQAMRELGWSPPRGENADPLADCYGCDRIREIVHVGIKDVDRRFTSTRCMICSRFPYKRNDHHTKKEEFPLR